MFSVKNTALGLAALCALALTACSNAPETTSFDAVKADGELVVLTLEGPTSYRSLDGDPVGYEVDLARAFAEAQGLRARFVPYDSVERLIAALNDGEGHIAAAGLTQTETRRETLAFGPAYKNVREQLVCRRGGPRPDSMDALGKVRIEVLAGSSYAETLTTLAADQPDLAFRTRQAGSAMPLLTRVEEQKTDCTVSDSNLVALARRGHPELVTALNLTGERPLAWAYNARVEGIADALEAWFARIHESGFLSDLDERWYGHLEDYDYVDARDFQRRVNDRLPRYARYFRTAASDAPFDWRLLAAQAYQESHWDPDAVSATGVRGLMMLTLPTAERVGVDNRLDPRQSVRGGADYLSELYERVPEDVTGGDRLWFALAAYNVGMGHVYDARAIAERKGWDKNDWDDLARALPLLTQPAYYNNTRYGYARGHEPVRYVQKIREYYDMLQLRDSL